MINYEIIFAYLDDAKKAYQEEKWEEFKVALRKAQNSIGELMQTLDFSYDISRNLYRIYVFCKDSLAAAMYKRSLTEIENAEKMLQKLYQSFCKVAETDSSAPMMKNTQQVYAGYTYGKGDLVENCQELDKSRGFFAYEVPEITVKVPFFLCLRAKIYNASAPSLTRRCSSRSDPDRQHFPDYYKHPAVRVRSGGGHP